MSSMHLVDGETIKTVQAKHVTDNPELGEDIFKTGKEG